MEVIRINERKMKIMLTATDMCHFELDSGSLGEGDPSTHRAFRRLLEELHRQTGFDADDQRVSVQFFPSREGGCEMFISRATNDAATSSGLLPGGYSGGKSIFCRECAFRIATLDDLMALCHRLYRKKSITESRAFRDKEGYYLQLRILTPTPFSLPSELYFLSEYGSLEDSSRLGIYISEHGSVIASEHAIEKLGGKGIEN